jgi:hypothetical protein
MKPTSLTALLALASNALAWRCDCGYSVNKTDSEHFSIFTHISETDFLHATNPNPKFSVQFPGWVALGGTPDDQKNRTFGYTRQSANVVTNTLPEGKWGGPTAKYGDAGVQLWVRHWTEKGLVPAAAMADFPNTAFDPMLYGSYRAGIKFSDVNGTRGALKWTTTEGTRTQNISMAVAAQDPRTLILAVRDQDPKNPEHDTSFDCAFNSIYNLAEEFHEIRFDLLPDRIDFYIDSHLVITESESVPSVAGSIMLTHHLDDSRKHPPTHDAVMIVDYMKAYYNATTHDEPLETCYEVTDNLCVVPDQLTPPNPNGNKTHFYSPVADDGEDKKDDEVTIGHAGYLQPDAPKNVASAAALWNGVLFASGLLLVAVVRFL